MHITRCPANRAQKLLMARDDSHGWQGKPDRWPEGVPALCDFRTVDRAFGPWQRLPDDERRSRSWMMWVFGLRLEASCEGMLRNDDLRNVKMHEQDSGHR